MKEAKLVVKIKLYERVAERLEETLIRVNDKLAKYYTQLGDIENKKEI